MKPSGSETLVVPIRSAPSYCFGVETFYFFTSFNRPTSARGAGDQDRCPTSGSTPRTESEDSGPQTPESLDTNAVTRGRTHCLVLR